MGMNTRNGIDWPHVSSLEMSDAEGWYSQVAAAPPEVQGHFGFKVERLDGATLMYAAREAFLGLNRVIGLGIQRDLTPAGLDDVLLRYERMGVDKVLLQLCPYVVREDIAKALEAQGIVALGRHAKLWQRPDAARRADTSLEIKEIDQSSADLYGQVAAEAYGDPPMLRGGHSATIGQQGWRHFLAFDGSRAVSTAALFVSEKRAWCGFAATLPSARSHGAHCALLAARVRAAAEQGCEVVTCETAEETEQRPNPSFRNMRRMGFEIAYYRTNYLWTGPGSSAGASSPQ
jgi:hypothetical protein